MKSKCYAIGDIHAMHRSLAQVLNKSGFNYRKDRLILLGDIIDGGTDANKTIELLMPIKDKILVKGNHERWFLEYLKFGWPDKEWLENGGGKTLLSYKYSIPKSHRQFLENARLFYEQDNMMFVHAGFLPGVHPSFQKEDYLVLGNELAIYAKNGGNVGTWDLVFVGHNSYFHKPIMLQNLVMADCGSGSGGRLAIIDTNKLAKAKNLKEGKNYWLSDMQTD